MTTNLAILLSVLLILLGSTFLLLVWALIYRPHPRIEGRLHVDDLDTPVEVLRDRWGVPHIYAESEHDLWFAQGFVHAQDRLWQMEQTRRVAAGRISEGVGEEGLSLDRFSRIIGFRRIAEAQAAALSADSRIVLARYAEGVNAYLARYRNRLPLEFTLLGLSPEPWTVTDTLSIGLLLGWSFTWNWREELAWVGFAARLGPERAAELLPHSDEASPLLFPGETAANLSSALLEAYTRMSDYIGFTAPGQGSNNWVVNGSKTISGRPLLANDPHVSVSMPALWHLTHLEARERQGNTPVRLIGASLPGVPGVLLGHNQFIAWGATAALPDTADLYVEQQHPTDPNRFRFGEEWEEAEVREEEIRVRGQDEPVMQRVTVTRHGPLITDLLSDYEADYPPLALRWTGAEPGAGTDAFLGMMRARNWDEFRAATAAMITPNLSLVYADREDNIGFITTGLVPIRAQGKGLVPSPGWTGTHEWTGFIPPNKMPQSYNPPNGQLFSANHRLVSDDYPYWWSGDFYPGYRARRIAELLEARPRHSIRDFQEMQNDTYSYLGRAIAPYFTLIDPVDPWERRAQKALLEWNYRLDRESTAGLVFEMTLYHLLKLVFADKLGPGTDDYLSIPRKGELPSQPFSYHAAAKLVELLQQSESWWFGKAATGQSRTREDLLALALKQAVATIKQEISDDARRWQWGRLHQISWQHPLGALRLFSKLLNRGPFPVGGSGQSINSQHWQYALPVQTVSVAPTLRTVIDLGNWDRSTFILCPGQSGLPGQRFYDNLMHIWLEGETIPMAFSREKVEQSDPLYRLKLLPGKA